MSGTGAKHRSPASRKVRVSSPAPVPTPSPSRRPTAKGKVATLSDADWPVARWQMMFEGLHDPAYLVDPLGVIRCANSASEHSPLNYPRNKTLGRALWEFFPAAQQASLKTAWAALLKSGQPSYLEAEATRRDGSLTPVGLSFWRLDQCPQYCFVVHDISQRVRLEDFARCPEAS